MLGIFLTSMGVYWIADSALMNSKQKALTGQLNQLQGLIETTYIERVASYKGILTHLSYKTIPYITVTGGNVLFNNANVSDNVMVDELGQLTGSEIGFLAHRDQQFFPVASSKKDADGKRHLDWSLKSDTPTYQALMKEETFFRTELNDKTWKIFAALPIFGDGDKVAAALFVSSSEGAHAILKKIVKQERIEQTGFYALANKDGEMLMSPDAIAGKDVKGLLAGSGNRTVDFDGRQHLVFEYDIGATGWRILAAVPQAELRADSRFLLGLASAIGGGLTILLCVCSWIFSTNLSNSFMQISNSLESSVKDVLDVSTALLTTGDQIASVSTSQVKSLEATAGEMKDIDRLTGDNRERAETSRTIADDNKDKAVDGLKQIQELLTAISKIETSNHEMTETLRSSTLQLRNFHEALKRIGEKTEIIHSVAFQSKLLSFNASVEAARAGEAGKGFSVVASEVAELANNSGRIAQEIRSAIEENLQYMAKVSDDLNSKMESVVAVNTSEIQAGNELANQVNQFFAAIGDQADVMKSAVESMSETSTQQTQRVSEALRGIGSLQTLSGENHATAEKIVELSVSLKEKSDKLTQIFNQITQLIKGHTKVESSPGPVQDNVEQLKAA